MEHTEKNDDRVAVGRNHAKLSLFRRLFGTIFVYLPIFCFPFVFLSACFTYIHLKIEGAKDIKPYRDFIPDWSSHRYNIKNQITVTSWRYPLAKFKLYWMFNCSLYCPVFVGTLAWHRYLVKVVENFYCPFKHSLKKMYCDAKIDQSYWHIYPEEVIKLTDEDRDNPIWNDKCPKA